MKRQIGQYAFGIVVICVFFFSFLGFPSSVFSSPEDFGRRIAANSRRTSEVSVAIIPGSRAEKSKTIKDPIFWVLTFVAIGMALFSVFVAQRVEWISALLFGAMFLGAMTTLWSSSVWPPVFLAAIVNGLLGWIAARQGFLQILEKNEAKRNKKEEGAGNSGKKNDVDIGAFLIGAALGITAVGMWLRLGSGFYGRVVSVGVALAALFVLVWRLRRPLVLWGLSLALGYLIWTLGGVLFVEGVTSEPFLLLGGVFFLLGVSGVILKNQEISSVLFGSLVLMGIIVVASGWAEGMWRQPVGWTVGLGLPSVYFGMGLALVQRMCREYRVGVDLEESP